MTKVVEIALTADDIVAINSGQVTDCFAILDNDQQILVRMRKQLATEQAPSAEEIEAMDRWIVDQNMDHGHGYSIYQSSQGVYDQKDLKKLTRRIGKKSCLDIYIGRQKAYFESRYHGKVPADLKRNIEATDTLPWM